MTVALLAGGPSLTMEQFDLVGAARAADRLRVIAINDSYLLAPWADVHYAADAKWHRWHTEGVDKPLLRLSAAEVRGRWLSFPGQKCTTHTAASAVPEAVHVMPCRDFSPQSSTVSLDPAVLMSGRHGGFQALNMAILAGASTILLLGYDACDGAAGERHFHGRHPVETDSPARRYATFRESFRLAQDDIRAAGVRVVNCSLVSSIDTFEKRPFEEMLA